MSPSNESSSTVEERAAQAVALIKQAVALLAITTPPSTARQRQRGLKFRRGVEPSIRVVAHLSQTYGVSVPGSTTAAMLASLGSAQALASVQIALRGALTVVDGAIHQQQGAAYGTALTLYGMLKKVGHRHAQIRATLAPVSAFFSYRARRPADASTAEAPEGHASTGAHATAP
jgi:hypothetical protein